MSDMSPDTMDSLHVRHYATYYLGSPGHAGD